MNLVPIDDPDDPRIAVYRNIRERDLTGREGRFIAEGEVVVRLLLGPSSRFRPASILIADKRIAALQPLLAAAPPGTPVYSAPQAVLDRIAGFSMHRGLLAIGEAGPPLAPEAVLKRSGDPALLVVAVAIANHDNMGGLFRNAAAFGAAGVLLDGACCDPLYRKSIRVSVGTALTVPFARLAAEIDIAKDLADNGFQAIALSPNGATTLAELSPSDRVAIVLGTEGPGLPAELLARLTTVRIPMAAGVDSLNVATAGGIVLHHIRQHWLAQSKVGGSR